MHDPSQYCATVIHVCVSYEWHNRLKVIGAPREEIFKNKITVSLHRTLDFNKLESLPHDVFKFQKIYDLYVISSGATYGATIYLSFSSNKPCWELLRT